MSIRDILRHHHGLGLPRAEIGVALSVSAGTVSNVLERAQAAGLSWPLPSDPDDDGLRARLYPPALRESGYAQPDWDGVLRELQAKRQRRRVRVTRRKLSEEYRDEAEAQGGRAYSYSQFCARLKAHQGSCGGSAQMHFDYEPGRVHRDRAGRFRHLAGPSRCGGSPCRNCPGLRTPFLAHRAAAPTPLGCERVDGDLRKRPGHCHGARDAPRGECPRRH